MVKGQNYENQNVKSQKVDQKLEKDQNVKSLLFVFFKLIRTSKMKWFIRTSKRTWKVKNDF